MTGLELAVTTFGEYGIDAALEWGDKVYFFRGTQYIQVSRRGETGPGRVDPGYPRNIDPDWNFPRGFGAGGISAAMIHPEFSDRVHFFSRGRYITVRMTAGTGPGEVMTPVPLDDAYFYPFKGSSDDPINAAIKWSDDISYFFRGSQFAQLERTVKANAPDFWGVHSGGMG